MNTQLGFTLALVFAVLFVGCGNDHGDTATNNYDAISVPQHVSEWRLGDKAVTQTPCAVNSTPLVSFSLAVEDVDILYTYFDSSGPAEDLTAYVLTRWGSSQECRWVRITGLNGQDFVGARMEILSGAQVLYGYSVKQMTASAQQFSLAVYTPDHNLRIDVEPVSSSEVHESYYANNQLVGQYNVAIDQGEAGYLLASNQSEIQIAQSLISDSTTLYDNLEGDRLVQLVTNQAFLNWYLVETGNATIPLSKFSLTRGFGWCALGSCALGWLPVCATCAVVDAGLLLTETMVCDWIPDLFGVNDGCDNLPGWW